MQSKFMRIKQLIGNIARGAWRFKYLVLLLVLLVTVAGGWIYYQASIENKWQNATDHYRRADYDGAAKILNGLQMPEKDADRLAIYAQTMLATRKLDKAAVAYGKLYELKKDPFAKLVLGNINNEQKKYDEAAKIYLEVIQSNPTYVQAYVNLATMYQLQGNNKKAVSTAVSGTVNNPNNTVLLELLVSLTMTDKNSRQFKEAVEKLKIVNPNDPLLVQLKQ